MPSPPRSGARGDARFCADALTKPPRVYRRLTVKLTRLTYLVGASRETLHFSFAGANKSSRAAHTFIKREDVPPFEGDEGWFEVELVEGKPWSYWRAVRQVEPPAGA